MVAAGTPDELRSPAVAEVRFGAPSGLAVTELAAAIGAPVREVTDGEYLVEAEGTPTLVAALTAWLAERDLALADLRAGRQRLEDVFLRLVDTSVAEPAVADEGRRRGRMGRRGQGGRS